MLPKKPIIAERVRKVPKQFSWLDHRLVRDRHIERCSHPAAALYLFLVTVSDAKGLSYYSEGSICKRLSMTPQCLREARDNLVLAGLIAWREPIYQVLSLDVAPNRRPRMDRALSLADIFANARGGPS